MVEVLTEAVVEAAGKVVEVAGDAAVAAATEVVEAATVPGVVGVVEGGGGEESGLVSAVTEVMVAAVTEVVCGEGVEEEEVEEEFNDGGDDAFCFSKR